MSFTRAKSVSLIPGPQQMVRGALPTEPEDSGLGENRSLTGRGIEIVVPVALRPLPRKGGDLIGFARQFEVEAVHQLVVGFGGDADGKSGLVGGDAGDGPVIEQFPGNAVVFSYRQIPEITKDEAMTCVEERERAVVGAGKRVENSFEAGGLVDRLAVGVGGGELQAVGKALIRARPGASCNRNWQSCPGQRCC